MKTGPREKAAPERRIADGLPVIVLCGFMGTGKTTVGHALASLLDVPLFDTDAMIESRAGATIAEIFARDGEDAFRSLEREACRSIAPAGAAVVATGGGTLLDDASFRHLSSLGTLVLLESPIDTIVRRTLHAGVRPRIPAGEGGRPDSAALAALLKARLPVYHRVAWRVDTSRRSAEETAFEIAERLRRPGSLIHLRVDTRPVPGHAPRPGESRLSRIVIGRGNLPRLGEWMREIGLAGPAFVFSSRRVAGHHGQRTRDALNAAGIANRFVEVNDDEHAKTLEQSEHLLYELADAGATRDATVVALGGGVTGDMAGFVAATYMRGVPFVQVPTTLLAQVDSSIGGKVGVNHPRAKNLIGTIHQPLLVFSDVETLSSLPPGQVASGMAEVVKTAIIGSPPLFEALMQDAAAGPIPGDGARLESMVSIAAGVKARIVEDDPYERGDRRLLNLGHTLGHALEAASGYGRMLHGEAVALGMLAAIRVSIGRGMATRDFLAATSLVLGACGLPLETPAVDRDELTRAMGLDKKRRAHGLVFVLPVAPGDVRIVDGVTEAEILATLDG